MDLEFEIINKRFSIIKNCNVDFYIEVMRDKMKYYASLNKIKDEKTQLKELTLLWQKVLGEIYNPKKLDYLLSLGFKDSCIERKNEKEPNGFFAWHLENSKEGEVERIWLETDIKNTRCDDFNFRRKINAEDSFMYSVPISEIRMIKVRIF